MTNLPQSRFDTRDLPSKIALDTWQDQISVLFDARVPKTGQDGFFASVDVFQLFGIRIQSIDALLIRGIAFIVNRLAQK